MVSIGNLREKVGRCVDIAQKEDMTETAKLLSPGFTVADAEYPSLSLHDNVLLLEFLDWKSKRIRVRFVNVAGVQWQELDSAGPEDRNDSVYEIIDSVWLGRYLSEGARTPEDNLRHFRLCFNASGVLDVLAALMDCAPE